MDKGLNALGTCARTRSTTASYVLRNNNPPTRLVTEAESTQTGTPPSASRGFWLQETYDHHLMTRSQVQLPADLHMVKVTFRFSCWHSGTLYSDAVVGP